MTTTTGARGTRSSALSSAVSMSFSSMVTTTSFSTLQPISSAMMAAVSKSMSWLREAMTPFFIRHLTTSAPVFFIRLASSPTLISSGIFTVSGVFLAISSCRRRSFSASSCLRLLEKVIWPRFLFPPPRIFSLPCCWAPPRRPPERSLRSARSWSFSSYLSRLTLVAFRVSTTLVWRGMDCLVCWACWGWARPGACRRSGRAGRRPEQAAACRRPAEAGPEPAAACRRPGPAGQGARSWALPARRRRRSPGCRRPGCAGSGTQRPCSVPSHPDSGRTSWGCQNTCPKCR